MPAGGLIGVSYNQYFQVPGVTLYGLDWDAGPRGLIESQPLVAGEFEAELPLALVPYATTGGGFIASYFDDYYNRIHVVPTELDFGAVVNSTARNLLIWNAYVDDTVTLATASFEGALGLAISGDAIPAVFLPLQSRLFTVTASATGPVSIDNILLLDFDTKPDVFVPLTGTRGKLWPFKPSWGPSGRSYQVQMAFLTEIITSRSGREQRIALRSSPRKSITYQSQLHGSDFDKFNQLIWSWQNRPFAQPDYSRSAALSAMVLPDDIYLQVDTAQPWMVEGALVTIETALGSTMVTMSDIDGTTLTLRGPSGIEAPGGSILRPSMSGYLSTQMPANRDTNRVARTEVRFDVLPISEPVLPVPIAGTTFNGREVFLKRPNWADRVSVSNEHQVDELDFDRGPITRFTAIPYGSQTRASTYLGRNRTEVYEIESMFRRMRGRQGEFYMPTWENDLPMKGPVLAASGALTVAGPDLAEAFGDSTVMRAMFVQLVDGTVLFRRVASVQAVDIDGALDSVVTIFGNWGQNLSAENVVQCGWMPVWRLSSDSLTIEWLTDSVANVKLTMTTLEDLTVESP